MITRPAMRSALALATALSLAAVGSASAQQTGTTTDTTRRTTSETRLRVTKEAGGQVEQPGAAASANMQMQGNVSGRQTPPSGQVSGSVSGAAAAPSGAAAGMRDSAAMRDSAGMMRDSAAMRAPAYPAPATDSAARARGDTTGATPLAGAPRTSPSGINSTGTTMSPGRTTGNMGAVGPAGSRPGAASGVTGDTTGNVTSAAAGNLADASAAGVLSAGNIAAVTTASNMDEVQTSELALQRATDASVKNYAQAMVAEHQALQRGLDSLLAAKGVTAQENSQSQQMKDRLASTLQQLSSQSGAQFDQAYMAHQVEAHQMTLTALDTQLIPSATDPELQAVLRDVVRPRVAQHLEQARAIHQGLSSR